jgi:hypothetical protein
LQDQALLFSLEACALIGRPIDRVFRFRVYERVLPPPSPSHRITAHVDGDPEQPRFERFLWIGAVQVLEGPKENFLRRVARVVSTAQQPRRQCHDAALVAQDDLFERGCIAAERQAQ